MRKKLLLLTMAISIGLLALAQVLCNESNHQVISAFPDSQKTKLMSHRFSNVQKASKKTALKENGETALVNVHLEYDKSNSSLDRNRIVFYSRDGKLIKYFDVDYETWYPYDDMTFEIPKGTYDVVAVFYSWNGLMKKYIVIQEDIEIDGTTDLTMDKAQASNIVRFKALLPNGEEMRPDSVRMTDSGNYELVTKGNVSSYDATIGVYHKDFGEIYQNSWLVGDLIEGVDATITANTVFISPVSDKYKAYENIFSRENANNYSNYSAEMLTDASSSHETINDISNYLVMPHKFSYTPAHYKEPYFSGIDGSWGWSCQRISTLNSQYLMKAIDSYFVPRETIPEEWFCSIGKNTDISLKWYAKPTNCELVDECSGVNLFWSVVAPQLINIEEKWKYEIFQTYSIFLLESNSSNKQETGHPLYSFYEDETDMDFGSTCPVMKLEFIEYVWGTACIVPSYIGNLGEERNVDLYNLTSSFKCGNKDFHPECQYDPNHYQYYWKTFDLEGDSYDFSFKDNNVTVDGLEGYNITAVHSNRAEEDHYPPTMMMLMPRNKNGLINNKFKNADEGYILFSAGDYNCMTDSEGNLFSEFKEIEDVRVEYSAYGSTDWLPIETTKEPDGYIPGFGDTYRIELSSIDSHSVNGWFNLKISLTDNAGNNQTQEFGPVFQIAEMTGISQNTSDKDNENIEWYNLQGMPIEHPVKGVNIRVKDGHFSKVIIK